MPTPTVTVTVTAGDQGGALAEGTLVTATLNRLEVYQGYVLPRTVEATADASGTPSTTWTHPTGARLATAWSSVWSSTS